MRRLFAVLAFLISCFPAVVSADTVSDLRACFILPVNETRLECYDNVARGLPAVNSGQAEQSRAAPASRAAPLVSPAAPSSSASCPCGSGSICTGPRGGRYCITSGGNKRYVK